MKVYQGEYLISRELIIEEIFVDSKTSEIVGCIVFKSETEEYFLDSKCFESLKKLTGMVAEVTDETVYCTYADCGESEEFEKVTAENSFETMPKTMDNQKWIREYLKGRETIIRLKVSGTIRMILGKTRK